MTLARALLLVLAVLASPALARAQDAAASAPVEDAARAFARGREAFDAQRFDEALEAFRRAYTLAPHDRVRFNVAVVLEELGRFREAAVEFDAVAASHQLDDDIRARAAASAQAARARLATLEIRSAHGVLDVEVDGAAACATPCEIEIDPGDHTISYRVDERAEERRVHAVSGARLAIVLELERVAPSVVEPSRGPLVDLGVLGGIGIGAAVVGAAGTIGFGLRATDLHDQWQRGGCAAISCDEGDVMTAMTNVSIAVLLSGLVALAVDLAFVDD
ncbi:tetratricopeptide repeat protein [Sandaracinus amylolyticus]|uniref:Uncharacterized protein n=1 Tax=Sandaracinus amylolyticus TaxID=927083 RepID=A0A0F6YL19_9BACT|nr:tetratricopeptide repeat protein [Sandaracinus amylolyticus]AKF09845.1 hypothetical protein DB32_006994 [Sandaracinus amylolyticus]